jgi:hypothetical protein
MFHYVGSIADADASRRLYAAQDALVEVVQVGTDVPVTIYANEAGNPISFSSGYQNRAIADNYGNYDFWVPDGTYDIKIYNAAGQAERRIAGLSMYGAPKSYQLTVLDPPYSAAGDGSAGDTAILEQWLAAQPTPYTNAPLPPGTYATTFAQAFQFAGRWDRNSAAIAKIGSRFLPFGDIRSDLTINVGTGEPFATLAQAVQYLKDRRIRGNFIVTLKVADGTYSGMTQIYWDHPDGGKVRIIGNQAARANCVLNFDAANNLSGFLIAPGCVLGYIDGFTVNGVGAWVSTGIWNANCYGGGINSTGGEVIVGPAVTVDKFYYSFIADHGGTLRIPLAGTVGKNAGDCAYHARYGGKLEVLGGLADIVSHTNGGVQLGSGFDADFGSTLWSRLCEGRFCNRGALKSGVGSSVTSFGIYAHDNPWYAVVSYGGDIEIGYDPIAGQATRITGNQAGVQSGNGGKIYINHPSTALAQITGNTFDGLNADNGGTILGTYLNVANNAGTWAKAINNGFIRVTGCTVTGNGNGNAVGTDTGRGSLVLVD